MELVPVSDDGVKSLNSSSEWRRQMRRLKKDFPENMRLSDEDIEHSRMPGKCELYVIDPREDWIQGSPIIWNGDFKNPLTDNGATYNYNDWIAALTHQSEAREEALELQEDADQPDVTIRNVWDVPPPQARVRPRVRPTTTRYLIEDE